MSELSAGMIVLWFGQTAPAGWAVCDGSNGTPDMRNLFPVGASGFSGGQPVSAVAGAAAATGGATQHFHVVENDQIAAGQGGDYTIYQFDGQSSFNTETAKHIPPFRAVFFIIKL